MTLPAGPPRLVRARSAAHRMNRLEAAYAQFLELQRRAGRIQVWAYESLTLKLAHDTRYTPDFLVIAVDDVLELHEVKGGFMRGDADVKLRVAAERFPFFRFRLVRRGGKGLGDWAITQVPPEDAP